MRLLPHKPSVRFVVDDKPSGSLYTRRHDRRVTPYPTQMQALIDQNLLTLVDLESQMARRQDTLHRDEEARPHGFCQVWQKLLRALGCV